MNAIDELPTTRFAPDSPSDIRSAVEADLATARANAIIVLGDPMATLAELRRVAGDVEAACSRAVYARRQ